MHPPLRITLNRLSVVLAFISPLALPQIVTSQPVPCAIVRGRVLDDSTHAPLPLANVFISGSTIGAAANAQGRFELKGVPLGSQQVVASIVGYSPGSITVELVDTSAKEVVIRLRPRVIQMAQVEIEAKDPVEWKKNLEIFTRTFFGTTRNASKSRLLNPQVLDFTVDEEENRFVATAREPLEIENRALGYRFRCVLVLFIQSPQSFQYAGFTAFQALQPQDPQEAEQWNENRRDAYYGSRRHFFASLVRKRAKEEGFEVNSITRESIQIALRRPAGFEVNPDTLLSPGELPFERKLSFRELLQVLYKRNHVAYVSLLELERLTAIIYTNGLNPPGIWTLGDWSNQRAAEMLPIDYEPE